MSLNMPQTIQLFFHGFYTVLVILLAAVLWKITEQFNSPTQTVSIIEVRPTQRHLTLVDMKSLYIEVYEIKLIIEQAFKAALIYSLLQSFHSLIAESYFIFYGILYSKNIPTYLIFNCAEWILCQGIKVYSISYSGNLLKNAVREHSRIHFASRFAEVLLALPTEGQNIRWFMEVQNLSTLLKYHSLDINLYGFFSLDATLLFNVLASALTYLIILAQFAE
ncbi:putative gustatory receptor 2a [Pieris rapae]|uniref:putative gustatory receptor 2a n=1 Tax=Pieris rapae TaxID=64459 RepID=UPI001E27D128|nr:putative gustatory receptor 2a [Pieris rapae]